MYQRGMSVRTSHKEDWRTDVFDQLEVPGQQGCDEDGEAQIGSDREWRQEVDRQDYSGRQ